MTYAISAETRTKLGRGAKQERYASRIPAVLYGSGVESKPVTVGRSEFLKVLKTAGYSSLLDMTVDGGQPVKTLIKEVQVHPLTLDPLHVDFYQVRMDKEIEAKIPLVFVGESKAVKNEGGTLVKSIDELEIRCLPANLPHEIEVDLSVLNTFEDSITVESLKLPNGVEAITDAGLTIATVERPLTEEELKKLEESALGDVTAVKTEADEKKEAKAAEEAAEAAVEEATKKE